jgi:hypothetical protein
MRRARGARRLPGRAVDRLGAWVRARGVVALWGVGGLLWYVSLVGTAALVGTGGGAA